MDSLSDFIMGENPSVWEHLTPRFSRDTQIEISIWAAGIM